ncbi:hypothetical protein Tco_1235346 [Tanacetum coccineum]
MRSEEELCPSDKRVAVIVSNLKINLDEFWHTVYKKESNKRYYFYMDYQQFEVGAELLRHAFKTSPKQPNQPFVKPPCQDKLVTFLKKLGYADSMTTISQVVVNKLHQPWRTFLSILNKCLTGKSSGVDRARELIVQILWGLVNLESVEFAKLILEDFSEEELVEKLKFIAKGEPKGKPTFGMPIPEAMMSREIKEKVRNNEFWKALGEGLGVGPDSPNHSDSTDNSIWESTNDDKTKSNKDSDHGDESDNSDQGDDNDDSNKEFDAGED